jgi:sensor histidine kinase YesM
MILVSRWRKFSRELGALLALSFAISVLLMLFFADRFQYAGVRNIAANLSFGMVYGLCIGGLNWLVLHRLAPRVWHRPPALRWAILLLTMAILAVAGSLAGAFLVKYALPFETGGTVVSIWRGSLRTSLILTLLAGSALTTLEAYKQRLAHTELETERARKLAAEAQLASLASRVEPHFLFNTLNSVTALIREDPAQAERTIERLSGLLRSSLDSSQSPLIPIEREWQLVADYLAIQSTRFGPRLRFHLEAAPPSGAVPPFAIQTLVENSIKYAVAPRPEGGEIRVAARSSGGAVEVLIDDDGPGFEPDRLPPGHGLDNLRQRLEALFGGRAALDFQRLQPGMSVRLRVPS